MGSKKNKNIIYALCYVILAIALASLIYAIVFVITDYKEKKRIESYPFELLRHEADLSYNENKSLLVKEVQSYIDSVAPSSSMSGYAIVDNCEKYDLDIKFVLAQGQIESTFGTKGMAAKTNSVFNVGAYDSKTYEEINGKFRYKHPDFSIEPYMQLLYRDYISGTKTELDLMANYVSKSGKRYASNPNYEKEILKTYEAISKNTRISHLQGEMRRFRIILGK